MVEKPIQRSPAREERPNRLHLRSRERALIASCDAMAALLAGFGAWTVWTKMLDREFLPWHVALLVALGVAWVATLTGSRVLNSRLRRSLLDDLPLGLNRILVTSMVLALGVSLLTLDPERAGVVLVATALGVITIGVARAVAYSVLTYHKGIAKQRVLIIGAGNIGKRVAGLLSRSYQPGMEFVGFLDKEPLGRSEGKEAGLPVLGSSYDLRQVIQGHEIDKVIIAFSTAPHHRILEIIWECDRLNVEVSIVPRFFEATTIQSFVENVGGTPLMHLNRARLVGYNALLKRAFDVAAVVAGLSVIWPLLLGIALAVKLDSPGPLIFSQKRIGCDGRVFTLYKFRSMRSDAESAGTWTIKQDPRRTRVGRVMRPLNLDELPQLFNVLKGEMSLVGPRPEQPSYVELFEQSVYRYAHRHRVKSGITGWAQVNGLRGDTSIEERVLFDNFYIENWSLWLDVKIILLTLFKSGVSAPERAAASSDDPAEDT